MKKYILFIGLSLSFNSIADSSCTGKLSVLSIGRGGTVLIKGPGGLPYVYLCNTEIKSNEVEPSACRAMYSTLLSAHAQDKEVDITFNPSISSCADLKNWGTAANLNWIMVK